MKKGLLVISTIVLATSIFAGCSNKSEGEKKGPEVAVHDINVVQWKEELDKITQIPGIQEMDLTTQEGADFYQINPTLINEGTYAFSMMNVKSDEFVIIEAKEGKEKEVNDAINAHVEAKKKMWETYLPDQYEQVKNVKVIQKDNIFVEVISFDVDAAVEKVKELVLAIK